SAAPDSHHRCQRRCDDSDRMGVGCSRKTGPPAGRDRFSEQNARARHDHCFHGAVSPSDNSGGEATITTCRETEGKERPVRAGDVSSTTCRETEGKERPVRAGDVYSTACRETEGKERLVQSPRDRSYFAHREQRRCQQLPQTVL